ncbi:TPA: hypothetical protein DEF17_08020 [bacterium]|nr:MAG: hypothetical protein AUJ18_10675 [Candidatus Hydrogenedentes bacterium CG1_02_42_14]PIU46592.1 MAG: hypothetical protein COS94_09745 [Candidatus Hydrogenedentes bacterium CG07_land_8_20_14_0_80_42_17]HBW47857.1 hypothetical protein [bacterium]
MPDELAEKYIDESNFEQAIKRLEELIAREENPGYRLRLATILFRIGKLSDALAHARRAAETDSEHKEDAVLLVGYCLRSLKRWREASKTFLNFSEEFPDSPRSRMARFSSALCLEELDDWAGAIEIYSSLSDDESTFRHAICLERSGRADDASALFESFLSRFGDSKEALKVRFRLGAMRVRQGRFEEAVRLLEDVMERGKGTFMGQIAERLIERARTKASHVAKQLRNYS